MAYTIIYGTLDQLPADGPGIYNRQPDPDCQHPLGMRWYIWDGDCLTPKGKIAAPLAVVCLDCGCGVPEKGRKPRPVLSRDECEALMHAEFLRHWVERDMPPATVANTLYYLFGKRAFPRPANYFRGRSCPDRRLAKLRGQPRGTPCALSAAREARALGVIMEFPRDLRRLGTGRFVRTDDGGYFAGRREAWMVSAAELRAAGIDPQQ